MIKLQISKQLPTHTIRSQFKLMLDFMHGDADATTHEVKYFDLKELEYLEQLVTVLDRLGEFGMDDWWTRSEEFEDFIRLCLPEISADRVEGIQSFFDEVTPGDATNDGNTQAQIEGFKVTFFDDNGFECAVELINQ